MVWYYNTSTADSTAYTGIDSMWNNTTATTTATATTIPSWQTYTIPSRRELQPESDFERRERELREEAIAERKKEAVERAKDLLLEYLDSENRQRYLDRKPLEVKSKIFSGVKYHIPISYDRVKAWKQGRVVSELCLRVRAPEPMPLEDILLAKLLLLENDEAEVLRTANHFNVQENLLAGLS